MLSVNVVIPNPISPSGAGFAGIQPVPTVLAAAAGVAVLIPPPLGSLMVAIDRHSSPEGLRLDTTT
jgi:hypothetical protein